VTRDDFSRIAGLGALITIALGAILYAINSPNRGIMYGCFIAGAVALAGFVFLNREAITVFSKKRSSRHGANMLVMILLFTCIIIIIQALSTRHSYRLDLTRNQRFSLASQTTNLLNGLNRDIEIYAFFKRGSQNRSWAENVINQYVHKNKHIRKEFVDPDQNPQLAKEMGITSYGTTVVKCGVRTELLTELSEGSLSNAILKVFREEVKGVYIVKGHGEKDPTNKEMNGYTFMSQAIEADNYAVYAISLFETDSIPDDCHLLIIAGPEEDYLESEIEQIETYLSKGKNAIIMIDPQTEVPNLEKLLAVYNIALDDNIIIDRYSRMSGGDYRVPLVSEHENHPITRNFNEAIFFPLTRSVRIIEQEIVGDVESRYLVRTGQSSWGETDMDGIRLGKASRSEEDVQPPVPIAAISSREIIVPDTSETGRKKLTSTIIVFGDSDFVNNSSFKILGNDDFLLNTVSFLAEEEDLIAIRPKEALGDRIYLSPSQERFIFLMSVILLPLIVIIIGTSIYMRRRKSG
jgi:ABC-type uncharacterized transport system involved in gliding motility auxiliary subunit